MSLVGIRSPFLEHVPGKKIIPPLVPVDGVYLLLAS
jgi:hypothetical protein